MHLNNAIAKNLALTGALAVTTALVAVACAPSEAVSQADFEAVSRQVAAKDQQLADKDNRVAELQKQLADREAATQGQQTILTARSNAPPRPTPTPPPPGFVAPPPPPMPAWYSEPVALYIYADTVTAGPGESQFNVDPDGIPNASCVISSVFRRGMHIVWRFEVVDISTGKRLTDKEMDKAVLRLPHGEERTGRFGRHLSDENWWWSAAWDVPMDYPLGVLDWDLTVTTKDGKKGSFKPWNVSVGDRRIESRTQIVG